MTRIIPRKLKAFVGVVAGEKASLDIKGGATIHEIRLRTNLTAAQMESVVVNLNGDPIYNLTGADLDMLEAYRKRYKTDGIFVINFADIVNASIESREFTALVTFPTDNITVEVQIAAGAVNPTLKASAEVSAAKAVRDFIPRKYRTSLKPGQNNNNTWDTLTRGPAIQRIHFEGDISRLKWSKDRLAVWERDADENVAQLKRMERAPQAGYYHFDAIESDFGIADLFQTADVREELVAEYDLTTVQTVPVLVEAVQKVTPINAQVQ